MGWIGRRPSGFEAEAESIHERDRKLRPKPKPMASVLKFEAESSGLQNYNLEAETEATGFQT